MSDLPPPLMEREADGTRQELFACDSSGAGPPLVLLHGLFGSARWWSRNIDAFTPHFRVHALDLTGFGASRRRGRFRIESALAGLVAWMDASEIGRTCVVGHSLGGLLATRMAAEHPERMEKVVLVDAALLALDPGIRRRMVGFANEIWRTPTDFIPTLAHDVLRADPSSVGAATYAMLNVDWRWALGRIAAPTLIVWGERDTMAPRVIGERMAAGIPGSRLEIVPDAGHNCMWDNAPAFNRLVLAFLRGLDPAAPSGDDDAPAAKPRRAELAD